MKRWVRWIGPESVLVDCAEMLRVGRTARQANTVGFLVRVEEDVWLRVSGSPPRDRLWKLEILQLGPTPGEQDL